jgi:hypothetical protein
MDDSGPRHPQRDPGKRAEHGHDWFALGGVLIPTEDEPRAREIHRGFCDHWQITAPLHSSEIRSQKEEFLWLRQLDEPRRSEFYESLYVTMRDAPLIGLACVVDRPGYNARYMEKYERNPWLLCKTAFSVAIERAAKYAISITKRLRVLPERCNKPEDRLMRSYYDDIRSNGTPFSVDSSGKYAPLTAKQLSDTLIEFRLKAKSSPMSQFADLFLWPMCMGGYHQSNRTYARLIADGKLIECVLSAEDWPTLASKYSCFEGVAKRP